MSERTPYQTVREHRQAGPRNWERISLELSYSFPGQTLLAFGDQQSPHVLVNCTTADLIALRELLTGVRL